MTAQDMRVPPHSPDAEQSVIGALLLDGGGIAKVAGVLRAEDFYGSSTATTYAAMLALHGAGRVADAVTVKVHLHETGRWSDALEQKLAQAAASVPSASGLLDYATVVLGLARRREGLFAAWKLEEALGAGDLPSAGIALAELRSAIEAAQSASLSSPPHKGMGWEERILGAFTTAAALVAEGGSEPEWVAEPWVAKGTITGIDGLPKGGGKTTFVLRIVAAVLDGVPFLGRPTTRTKVVYLTEEPRTSFVAAMRRAGLLGRDDLFILRRQDIAGAPWHDVVGAALAYCERVGAGLLVTDTFPPFAGLRGDDENSAGAMLAAVEPLYAVTEKGIAVVLTRHERKAQGEPGSSGRGSNAFTGAVETVITIRRTKGGSPNARDLACLSRFDQVPAALTIELTPEGFVVSGDEPESDLRARLLTAVPGSEDEAATEAELADRVGGASSSVNRILNRLQDDGKVRRRGAGGKADPYRYWKESGSSSSSQTPMEEENKDHPAAPGAEDRP